jgi:hypothetical protein
LESGISQTQLIAMSRILWALQMPGERIDLTTDLYQYNTLFELLTTHATQQRHSHIAAEVSS